MLISYRIKKDYKGWCRNRNWKTIGFVCHWWAESLPVAYKARIKWRMTWDVPIQVFNDVTYISMGKPNLPWNLNSLRNLKPRNHLNRHPLSFYLSSLRRSFSFCQVQAGSVQVTQAETSCLNRASASMSGAGLRRKAPRPTPDVLWGVAVDQLPRWHCSHGILLENHPRAPRRPPDF